MPFSRTFALPFMFAISAPTSHPLRSSLILQFPSLDSKAVLAMAVDTGCPVVYPLYTLTPVGTAAQCIEGGLKLLVKIHQNPTYRDHQIIVTGASAGAWIALRLTLALGEIILGKATVRSADSRDIVERGMDASLIPHADGAAALDIARRICEVVLQSPWVDTDLSHPLNRCHESKVSA
jgi:acetyl esterase/lipase